MKRSLPVFVAVALLAGAAATAALAHVDTKSRSPKAGGTAKTSIRAVRITFSGPIRRGTMKVVGPRGRVVSAGRGGRDPRNVKRLAVALKRRLQPGRYRASWSIVAADGHRQRGSFRFRLAR